MLEVTKRRPMNNEYVNSWIGKLSLWLRFLNFTANFYRRWKQETTRSTVKCFILPAFPLSGKSNYEVEEFSTERQRANKVIFHQEEFSVRRDIFFVQIAIGREWASKDKRKYHSEGKIPPSGKQPLSCGSITSPPKVRRVVGIPCQFSIERTPTPSLV